MERVIEDFVEEQTKSVEKERAYEAEQTQILVGKISATQLQKLGLALVALRITAVRSGSGGRTVVTLEAPVAGEALQATALRGGDIVGIEAAGGGKRTEDDKKSQRLEGVLMSITQNKATVALGPDDEIPDAWRERCTLRRLATDITYRRILRALTDLQRPPSGQSRPYLHSVLFGDLSPRQHTVSVDFLDDSLNESQKEAVRLCVGAEDLALVHGPPGTGKTHTVVEIVRQLCALGKRILVCAPSNVAVDNLTERLGRARDVSLVRLGHAARVLPAAAAFGLDTVVRASDGGQIVRDIRADIDRALAKVRKATWAERRALYAEIRELRKELRVREALAVQRTMDSSRVVLATLSGAGGRELASRRFDVVVVDEATQASEAECWIAALKAPKLILAGDHHQLPPTAKLPDTEVDTMFDRVRNKIPDACRMLTTQYRMHREIAQVSSDQLYDGRLVPDASVAEHLLYHLPHVEETEDTACALVLLDTMGAAMFETDEADALPMADADSKCNRGEADLAARHVRALVAAGVLAGEIAVISPYNAQVRLLKVLLREEFPEMEIGSVDGFQGREKEAVVLSLVRSNESKDVGFLKDYRRINVAVTRARRHVCVVADSETVSQGSKFLSALFAHLEDTADIRYADQM
ncbi:hypothetical protein IW150_004454 [Coemansia sp. RSA 2607]|nr:hypothetical protein IW150_004454 [Coemansia sp. RSA 2607]KAJ2396069.1 hypothetical protein GGI05_001294 [Coemansia sp. RSA 2603]